MVLREKSLTGLLLVAGVVGSLWGHDAAAQENASGARSAMKLELSGLHRTGVQPGPFKPNPFAKVLGQNRHNFAGAPPLDLASQLENANLPTASVKRRAFADLSGTNFLAPARQPGAQFGAFRNFSTPGLDTSKILRTKPPNLSKTR